MHRGHHSRRENLPRTQRGILHAENMGSAGTTFWSAGLESVRPQPLPPGSDDCRLAPAPEGTDTGLGPVPEGVGGSGLSHHGESEEEGGAGGAPGRRLGLNGDRQGSLTTCSHKRAWDRTCTVERGGGRPPRAAAL